MFSTKINANIGNSATSSCPHDEFVKLETAMKYGADTVMDLSAGGDIKLVRAVLLVKSTIPVARCRFTRSSPASAPRGFRAKRFCR